MVVVLFFISVFAYKLADMFMRNQTQIKKNTLVNVSNTYTPPENLSAKNISIAFLVSDYFGDFDYHDDRFVKVTLT